MAQKRFHTYHCICAELACALTTPLQQTPKRSKDNAATCSLLPASLSTAPQSEGSIVLASGTSIDPEPVVLKLEDGFEKRYAVKCGRCDLQIGYLLDHASFGDGCGNGRKEDVVYLLPGGLVETGEMREGKDMSAEVETIVGKVGAGG